MNMTVIECSNSRLKVGNHRMLVENMSLAAAVVFHKERTYYG